MNRPTPAHLEMARRMLANEGTEAGRVYEKLHSCLDALLGIGGVHALLVRSAKLAGGEYPFLEAAVLADSPQALRNCLEAQDPPVAEQSAHALFGGFFALVTTFIGERLTTQALRRTWPAIDEPSSGEKMGRKEDE